MGKNDDFFAQDAETVMLGRPPIEGSILQQMFYKCVSNSPVAPTRTNQQDISESNQHVVAKTKG